MSGADHLLDDALLRRVALARPRVPEADLSPTGERAVAILARIADGEPAADVTPRWRRHLARAASRRRSPRGPRPH